MSIVSEISVVLHLYSMTQIKPVSQKKNVLWGGRVVRQSDDSRIFFLRGVIKVRLVWPI